MCRRLSVFALTVLGLRRDKSDVCVRLFHAESAKNAKKGLVEGHDLPAPWRKGSGSYAFEIDSQIILWLTYIMCYINI